MGDQSVIQNEINEVTAQPNVAATQMPSGKHILVPEQPAPPPPPVPRVGKEEAPPQPQRPAETRAAQREADIKSALSAGPTVPRVPHILHEPSTAPDRPPTPVDRPPPGDRAAAMVPGSAPDMLRAQLPEWVPPLEDFLIDWADERSPAEKKAHAESQTAGLTAAGNQHKAALAGDVATHRRSIQQFGHAQRAAIHARHASRSAQLNQRAASAKAALQVAAGRTKQELRAAADRDMAAIGQATNQKVGQAQTAFAARRKSMTDAVDAERTAALAFADAETNRAVGELENAAAQCEQAGEQEGSRFTGDKADKQRDASRKVGQDSARDIRSKKGSIGAELRKQATQHASHCAEHIRGVLTKIDQAEQALLPELRKAGTEAQAAVRDGLTGALTGVDNRLTHDTTAVDAAAAAARGQLQSAAHRSTTELDTGVIAAHHDLDTVNAAAHRHIDNTVEETTTVVTEPERPFLPGVAHQIHSAKSGIAGATGAARTHLTTATQGTAGHFQAVTAGFDTAAGQLVEHLAAPLGQIQAGFTAAGSHLAATRTQAASAVLTGLGERQQGLTDEILAEVDKACQQTHADLATMRGKCQGGIRDAANRSVQEGSRPRTDDVHTRAREAGEQAGEGWLAGLGRALVQLAVGLVVLVVVALVVAAIAAAFGVILTAWGAIMIAGAILLAVVLVIALIQRFNQKELDGKPGLAVLMALSDTVGITGITQAITGKDMITGQPLSDADRTEGGILGAVTLVSLVFGARAAIKGPPGGGFVRPMELPSGWRGVVPRIWRGVSSVGRDAWNGLSQGVKSFREWLRGKKADASPELSGTGEGRPEQTGGSGVEETSPGKSGDGTPSRSQEPAPPQQPAAGPAQTKLAETIGVEPESLARFTTEQAEAINTRAEGLSRDRLNGLRNFITRNMQRDRSPQSITDTITRMDKKTLNEFLDNEAGVRWPARFRGRAHIEDGNANEGWQHIHERHIPGGAPPAEQADLFPAGTTRAELEALANDLVQHGQRITPAGRRLQTFEGRATVHGKSDRVSVTVDAADGRVISIFPMRGGG